MFCPNCGVQIPDQVAFCPKCGARLSKGNRIVARMTCQPVKTDGLTDPLGGLPLIIKVLMAAETVLSMLVFLDGFMRFFDRGEDIVDFMSLYGVSAVISGSVLFFLAVMVPLMILIFLAVGGIIAFIPHSGWGIKAHRNMAYCGAIILVLCLFCGGFGEDILENLFGSLSSYDGPALAVSAYLTGWVEEQMGILLLVGAIPIATAVLSGWVGRRRANNNS